MKLNPTGGCGCCKGIGFDRGSPFNLPSLDPDWFSGFSTVVFNAVTTGELGNIGFLVAGSPVNQCGPAMTGLPMRSWDDIKAWIESGGRMWLQGEYHQCIGDPITFNDFLEYIGSSISIGSDDLDGGGCPNPVTEIPGGAAIATGTKLTVWDTNSVSGGTTAFTSVETGAGVAAIEKIGDGYIFVAGDSNIFGGCETTPKNIQLIKDNMKLIEKLFDSDAVLI